MINKRPRHGSTPAAPARKPRQRKPRRDLTHRQRRHEHWHERIAQADRDNPWALISAAMDYLRANLRFIRSPEQLWRIARQVSEVIVRVADSLEEHVTRGGNQ